MSNHGEIITYGENTLPLPESNIITSVGIFYQCENNVIPIGFGGRGEKD
jgi:hypothetical protein